MMKRCILFLLVSFFFISITSNSQEGNWRRILDKATYDVAVNPKNPNTIVAGGEGRAFHRSFDGGKTWQTLPVGFFGGRSQFNNVLIHPVDTNVVLVGGLLFGDVRRSTNLGETWTIVLQRDRPISLNGKAMFIDPHNPNLMYIGEFNSAIIYRSTDAGLTWDSISTVKKLKRITDENGNPKDTLIPILIASMGMREDSSNILLCGSTSADVFISTDGGVTWKFTDSLRTLQPFDASDGEITRLIFSNRDPKVGYAVITYIFDENIPNGGLWKTTDGGYNWDLLAFADTSMWAVAARKFEDEDEIFIGGYTEAYYHYKHLPGVGIVRGSTNSGKTWKSFDESMDWFYENPQAKGNLYNLHFPEPNFGYVVGDNGIAMKTVNTGLLWTPYLPNYRNKIFSVHFPTASVGYLCGEQGTIFKSTDRGESWAQLSTNVIDTLKSVYFINADTGLVVGDNGTILRTTNQGVSWENLSLENKIPLNSIKFISENTGFVIGKEGTLLKTTDLGYNWISINLNTTQELKSIHFVNNLGFISGVNGLFYKSTNSGNTWTKLNIPTTKDLNSVFFVNETTGFVAGQDGTILKTTDGGINWFPLCPFKYYSCYSQAYKDSIGYITGEYGMVLMTTNSGKSWEKLPSRTIFDLYKVTILNDSTILAVGNYGYIIKSSDSGKSWFRKNYENYVINSFAFADQNIGYAVTDQGFLLKTTDSGEKWSKQNLTEGKLNDIIFINPNLGFIVADSGKIFKTTDSGNNWNENFVNTSNNLLSIAFYNDNIGLIAGTNGTLLKTTNTGETWFQLNSNTLQSLKNIYIKDANTYFVCGEGGIIIKSANGGQSWNLVESYTTHNLNSIHFFNENDGIVIGSKISGIILITSDGGNTWTRQITDSSYQFNSIFFVNKDTGWVAGNDRMIFNTTDGGNEWFASLWDQGTRANVWSQRYFGDPGNETLYMATEAGLFVFETPSPVQEEEKKNTIFPNNLIVFQNSYNSIYIKYKKLFENSNSIRIRISNYIGELLIDTEITDINPEIILPQFALNKLPRGMFICQVIEQGISSTKLFVFE